MWTIWYEYYKNGVWFQRSRTRHKCTTKTIFLFFFFHPQTKAILALIDICILALSSLNRYNKNQRKYEQNFEFSRKKCTYESAFSSLSFAAINFNFHRFFSKDVSRVLCWQNFDFQFCSCVTLSCLKITIFTASWNYCEAKKIPPEEHSTNIF